MSDPVKAIDGKHSERRAWHSWEPFLAPIDRRHASSVQVLCAFGASVLLLGEGVRWHAQSFADPPMTVMHLSAVVLLLVAFFLVGRRLFRAGLAFFIIGVVVISGAGVAFTGLAYSSGSLQNLAIPLALAALLVGRKALWTTTIFYAVALAVGAARDSGLLGGVGPRIATVSPIRHLGSALISFCIISVILDRVGLSLRDGFALALARQKELERATTDLAEANAALKEEMARRQSAEAQLIEAQKMEAIARLSGGIAHDFNNLLTVILSCTDLSKETLHPDHPVRPNLDDIGEAAERAAELTRQLLAFARRQMVEPRVLCVADRVRATEKMLARLLGEDVRLVTRFAAEAWLVQVDPGQLDQVILNFAVNARDAMPEGGKLLVATKNVTLLESKSSSLFSIPAGDYLMLEISDEGIGMDAETGSRLFEPFFTTKAHGKGTGLGLATCYGIMLQAGGAIFFQTEIGRGTTFHLYFPRVLDLPLSLPPQSGRITSRGRGERVLVVEDEARVRAVTVQILEGVGYVVLQAGGMEEALQVVQETPEEIALLITDVVLSDGSGRETAGEVADMRPDIAVLYVSGYTDDSILRHGIFEKGIEFLAKPFTPSELAARVRQVIDRNRPRGGLVDAGNT